MFPLVVSSLDHGFIISPKRDRKTVPSIEISDENVSTQIPRRLTIEFYYILNASIKSHKSWSLI